MAECASRIPKTEQDVSENVSEVRSAGGEYLPRADELPHGDRQANCSLEKVPPDGRGAEAPDGNSANEGFIVRQRRLTELVKELSSPNKHDVLPLIVGVSDLESDTVSLHIPEKAPEDVVETLFGFVAPPSWEGLIVVAHGRAYCEGEVEDHVTIGYGLGRGGEEVSVLRRKTEVMVSTLSAEGRVLDCCRRAFGLSTPPAQEGIVELFIAAWLGRIFRAAGGDAADIGDAAEGAGEAGTRELCLAGSDQDSLVDLGDSSEVGSLRAEAYLANCGEAGDWGGDALDWPLLLKLHPLVEGEHRLSPIEVGAQARELCRKGSWGRLRRAVETGEMPHSSITSEAAAWMDDSMFARWCLAAFPDTSELTDQLGELLPPELHQMMMKSLEEQRS